MDKRRKIPRGKGYDKASIKKHIRKLNALEYPKTGKGIEPNLVKYCRSEGLTVDYFARACEKYEMVWWARRMAQDGSLVHIPCAYCKTYFYPNSKRQFFCSKACSQDSSRDKSYFGGNRQSGIGVRERICQICLKQIEKNLHVHHIYGKGNDPDNEYLVALCSGCHQTLEQICLRNQADTEQYWERMIAYVWAKRNGVQNPGKRLNPNVLFRVEHSS